MESGAGLPGVLSRVWYANTQGCVDASVRETSARARHPCWPNITFHPIAPMSHSAGLKGRGLGAAGERGR